MDSNLWIITIILVVLGSILITMIKIMATAVTAVKREFRSIKGADRQACILKASLTVYLLALTTGTVIIFTIFMAIFLPVVIHYF